MSESGKSDRWNSLLETLGVPVSETQPAPPTSETPAGDAPAAPAKPKAVSMLRPEKAKAAPKPKPAAPQAKSPSYWSRIAGALGLEVPSQPEPPPAEEEPIPQPESCESEEPPRAFDRPTREKAREHRPAREERPWEKEFAPENEPVQRSTLDEMFGPKTPDVDVFGLGIESNSPRMREPSPAHA